jgi:hypothetical protein
MRETAGPVRCETDQTRMLSSRDPEVNLWSNTIFLREEAVCSLANHSIVNDSGLVAQASCFVSWDPSRRPEYTVLQYRVTSLGDPEICESHI